jgi:cell division protein FtsB
VTEKKPSSIRKRLFTSRLVLVGGLIVLALVVWAFSREFVRRVEINQQVDEIKAEIERLEGANSELADMIQYFGTKNYQEKEARRKLGLAKPGEKVIAVPSPEVQRETPNEVVENEVAVNTVTEEEQTSNPRRWWDYFFGVE